MVAVVAIVGAAFRLAPEEVTEVSTPPTGLWVPSLTSGEIVYVDGASAGVTASVALPDMAGDLDISERDNGVITVDHVTGAVNLIDPALQTVQRTVAGVAANGRVDIGPEAIALAADDEVGVVDLEVRSFIGADVDGPTRSVASDGLGAEAENGATRVGVDETGSIDASERSDGILVRVREQVVEVAADQIRRPGGGSVGCLEAPIGSPDHVIGTDDNWVVVVDGSRLHVSDLDDRECVVIELDAVAGQLSRPVVSGRRVFVPDRGDDVVHIVNPATGAVITAPTFAATELRVRARGDFVAAYDLSSRFIVLIDINGESRLVDTSRGGGGISTEFIDEGEAAIVGGDDNAPGIEIDGAEGPEGLTGDAPVIDAGVLASNIRDAGEAGEEPPPSDELVAFFASGANTVGVGETVRFVDSSTGRPETWRWDFGDGNGDEGPELVYRWSDPGTYTVTLFVTRGSEADDFSQDITVVPSDAPVPLNADFVSSATVVEVGGEVAFEDRSAGEIERWRWDFGDGESAINANVTHSWDEPGRYTVQLTVANPQGADDARAVIEVREGLVAPVAEISVASTDVDLGSPLRFTARSLTDPARFRWDFGDGRTSAQQSVDHVFLEEGNFSVVLFAENDAGDDTARVSIRVTAPTRPPVAAIASLPDIIEVGEEITLTSLATNSPDTELWSFGDGTSDSGPVVTHTWDAPGDYILRLIATNAAGEDSITQTVEVVPQLPAPRAIIGSFDDSPWVGQSVVFFDESQNATSWFWDFGDGGTSTAQNPLHTFTAAGPTTVTLVVTNRNGEDTDIAVVEPRLQPDARFVVSDTAIRAGDSVEFTDQSVNAVNWTYRFGDGTQSGNPNPVHTFASTGEFDVFLEVENATGDSDTFGPVTISVDPAAPLLQSIAVQTGALGSIITESTVTFVAEPDPASGPIVEYQIDFGDGSGLANGTAPSFAHVYSTAGEYEVRMRARGPLGDWSPAITRTATVVDPPPPVISISPSVPATALVGPVNLVGVTDVGSGPIDTWRWTVTGPGTAATLTGQNVTFAFPVDGAFTIALEAEGPVDSASVSQPITITLPPAPDITALVASSAISTVGLTVQFTPEITGSVETYEWDYGLGFNVGGPIGEGLFNTPGEKTVQLRVTGPFARVDTASVTVTVMPAPSPAQPVANPASPVLTGTAVQFTSLDGGGLSDLTWTWEVTNGGTLIPYSTPTPVLNHTFDTAGDWTITVFATDSRGVVDSAVAFMTVQDPVPPLVANFSAAALGTSIVQFTDLSTGPPVTSWLWDFGDALAVGDTAAQNPQVTYSLPGTYSVTLTVTSGGTVSAPITLLVTAS